jgi:hypothetical protein
MLHFIWTCILDMYAAHRHTIVRHRSQLRVPLLHEILLVPLPKTPHATSTNIPNIQDRNTFKKRVQEERVL